MPKAQALQISEYIIISSCLSKSTKTKKKIHKFNPNVKVKIIFENELQKTLKQCKTNYPGVIYDTVHITHDITLLPPIPNEPFKQLCLEAEIKNYLAPAELYWVKTDIVDSYNYIINNVNVNNVNTIYTITQYQLSVRDSNWLGLNFTTKQSIGISNELLDKTIYNHFQTIPVPISSNSSHTSDVPPTSFITFYESKNTMYHTLVTFFVSCKLSDELIIVVPPTKKIPPNVLPNDKRIKLIQLEGVISPTLGFVLNAGVKHAVNNRIAHLFPFSIYNPDYFNCDTVNKISYNTITTTGTAGTTTGTATNYPDLANLIYSKDFWRTCSFDETKNTEMSIVYEFIKYRTKLLKFVYSKSFTTKSLNFTPLQGTNNTYINVHSKLRESYTLNFM